MSDKLIEAINEIANLPNEDKIPIKGKFYTTVDKRLQTLRKHLGADVSVTTDIILHDLERVVVRASISIYINDSWSVIGIDYAEEFRAQGPVNKTSAVENCCTSAIGRALASCGLGGGEYASSFEMENAINTKPKSPNLKEGLLIRNDGGQPMNSYRTPNDYITALREIMSPLDDIGRSKVFANNSKDIERAYTSLKEGDTDKPAYEKMIDLYHD